MKAIIDFSSYIDKRINNVEINLPFTPRKGEFIEEDFFADELFKNNSESVLNELWERIHNKGYCVVRYIIHCYVNNIYSLQIALEISGESEWYKKNM